MNSSPSGVGGAVGSGVGPVDAPAEALAVGPLEAGGVDAPEPAEAFAAGGGVAVLEPVHAAMTGARAAAPPRIAIRSSR